MNDFCVFIGTNNILTNDKNIYLEFLFTIFSPYYSGNIKCYFCV